MRIRFNSRLIMLALASSVGMFDPVLVQGQTAIGLTVSEDASILVDDTAGLVNYSAEFFRRYQPNTALDMVRRVPGFTVDDGGDQRGFGGAAGNILINNRRPSTKQDSPSAILGRISAGLVERIELIRVRVRDIDLLGQAAVVNVILHGDAPAAIRWSLNLRQNLDHGSSPGGAISLADRWGEIEYNVGVDGRLANFGDPGTLKSFNSDGVVTEIRNDVDTGDGPTANGYLNASTWLGNTIFQLNTRVGIQNQDMLLTSSFIPQLPGNEPRQVIIESFMRNKTLELGLDAERVIQPDLLGKAILLYSLRDQNPSSSQQSINAAGIQTRYQLQEDDKTSTETITRIEFDWAGLENHAIQLDLELAMNVLDNVQIFTDDTGAGSVIVDVPGGNTRVEEDRWNLLLQDTWSIGKFDLDYGIGLERSQISQSGDAKEKRQFTFVKPRIVLTYSPMRARQARVRLEREIAQLDFNDFVSAAVFEDDNLALGNPDLRPDSTWIAESSYEQRYGEVGVIKLTGFYHWITDVLDLLPLTPTFDAPGNIGNGQRWGLILETTTPLDWTGLKDAQLGFSARWQDSAVVDPVTGANRVLSGESGYRGDMSLFNENSYAYEFIYRQDFEEQRVSWGWSLLERAKRPVYRVNELDIYDEGSELEAFIETTRWFDLNIRIDGQNLLNPVQKRDRTVFIGERSLSPIVRREIRNGTNGARILLTVSGTF